VVDRWATFDCYGTLIDWNSGIGDALAGLFGDARRGELLHRYHVLEPQVQSEGYRSYAEVMTFTVERLAAEQALPLANGDAGRLARSLPEWPPFGEVPPALDEVRRRGWRLAILSNSDRDLIAASQQRLGVPFDETIVAQDVRSYKPAPTHWTQFFTRTRADRGRHVHVAASLFHDIAPAQRLGLTSVWINRLGEQADPEPTRELVDLSQLPDTLDELVSR
jgi:2-haloacid dehalogenase